MQRASVAMPALMGGALPAATPILPIEIIGQAALKNYKATSILLLLNTVAPDTLEDDDQYQDIVQDIQDECERFGKVTEVIIPRPLEGAEIPGLGKVFIKYESAKDAAEAHRSLAGRKYEDRVVLTTFFDEIKYGKRKFE